MDASLRDEMKAFMTELAQASGELILRYWRDEEHLRVERKADSTPVTEADRGAERLMRAMIAQRYPAHGIIAEEFGNERADAEFVWVLDPIDGTKSFISHVPLVKIKGHALPVGLLGTCTKFLLGATTVTLSFYWELLQKFLLGAILNSNDD